MEGALNISEKQYETYWDKGWLVVEGVYGSKEVDEIAELAVTVAEKESAEATSSYQLDSSPDGATQAPRKIESPFLKEHRFQDFVTAPHLTTILTKLLGEKPLLRSDQIFLKPPQFGSAKPYHQDNYYFQCHPDNHVITAWIALDDVAVENGCLRYIDGSHIGPILPHFPIPGQESYNLVPSPEQIDLNNESLATVQKGGVVFHHSKTLHTSHRNESTRWRRGYATHWITGKVTCKDNSLDQALFHHPEFKKRVCK